MVKVVLEMEGKRYTVFLSRVPNKGELVNCAEMPQTCEVLTVEHIANPVCYSTDHVVRSMPLTTQAIVTVKPTED